MTAKIVEVLAKILEALSNNYSLEEVNTSLSKDKAFDKQTVSTAFSWVLDKRLANLPLSQNKNIKNNSIRILSEEEKELLGLENYKYLTHLLAVGLLRDVDLDLILEQVALYPGDVITKDEINWLILFSLVGFDENILPGSRVLLYSSDTIN